MDTARLAVGRGSTSGWTRVDWRLDAGHSGFTRSGDTARLHDFNRRRSAPTDGRDWATFGFVAKGTRSESGGATGSESRVERREEDWLARDEWRCGSADLQ